MENLHLMQDLPNAIRLSFFPSGLLGTAALPLIDSPLGAIAAGIAAGRIRSLRVRTFDFGQVREAHALMEQLGWQVRPSQEGLEAVVTTGWFGFQDDVALRVFAGPKETRIDMRSASRQGQSDLGTNRARIEEFLIRLNERLGQAYKPNLKQ